jgi:hypothetical protein
MTGWKRGVSICGGRFLSTVFALAPSFVFASSSNKSAGPPAALAARAPGAILAAACYRWLLMAAAGGVIGALVALSASGPASAAVFGLLAIVICALFGGLGTWLYHYRLRWLLARKGLLPRRLPDFLFWCAEPERSWLRVCDGYEFRHRELLDYLADRSDGRPA